MFFLVDRQQAKTPHRSASIIYLTDKCELPVTSKYLYLWIRALLTGPSLGGFPRTAEKSENMKNTLGDLDAIKIKVLSAPTAFLRMPTFR